MAKFPRGHAATKKLIASCALNQVGIDGLPDAPSFRFTPRWQTAGEELACDAYQGRDEGAPTGRGTTYFGKPKPKHIKNWTPARMDMNPMYSVGMAGDDRELTAARARWAKGDAQPLRDYLRAQAAKRRTAAQPVEAEPFQYALAA